MVLLHVKRDEKRQFIVESTLDTPTDEAVRVVIELNNARERLARLCDAALDYAKYGFAKPVDEQGLSTELAKLNVDGESSSSSSSSASSSSEEDGNGEAEGDPTHRRTNKPPTEEAQGTIEKAVADARSLLDKEQAERRKTCSMEQVEGAFAELRGALLIAANDQPFPEWDPVAMIMEGTEVLEGSAHAKEVFDADKDAVWFGSKELLRDEDFVLRDFVGKYEKSKVIVKLARHGSGAPVREPTVDPETQKQMMAYYHKKQQEEERMNGDNDDSYLSQQWANSSSLKANFQGMGNISFLPK